MKAFFERASAVYTAAYQLNSNPDLDGEPCCAAFRVARQLLIDRYGADVGAHVHNVVLDCGEYSPGYLASILDPRRWAYGELDHGSGEVEP